MEPTAQITFKGLRKHMAAAIKESCYKFDGRFYNIANQVNKIETTGTKTGIDNVAGLSKIIDKTIKDAVGVGCDLSVIVKGIFVGSFRSSPSKLPEAKKTISVLIAEILLPVSKYEGDVKQAIEGLSAAVVVIVYEFGLNAHETLIIAKEEILFSSKVIGAKFAEEVEKAL